MRKKIIILIFIISILALFGYFYFDNNNQEEDNIKIDLSVSEITYDDILAYQDGIFLVKEDNSYLIVNNQKKIIDHLDYDYSEVTLLPDGYYIYQNYEDISLRKDGSLVSMIDPNDLEKAYHTSNSKYFYYSNYSSYLKNGIINNYNYETKEITSFWYDLDTSIIKENFNGELKPLKKDYYYVNEKDKSYILDLKSEDIILNNFIITDYNKDYLIGKKNNKLGMIDYHGKVVIDFLYDELEFTKKEGLFKYTLNNEKGLLNLENKKLFSGAYTRLDILENYILTFLDNTIQILDQDFNNLDITYQTNNYSYIEENNLLIVDLDNEEYSNIIIKDNKLIYELNLDDQIKLVKLNNQVKNIVIDTLNDNKTHTLTIYDNNFMKKTSFKLNIDLINYEITSVNENILKLSVNDQVLYLDILKEEVLEKTNYEVKILDDQYLYYVKNDQIYLLDYNYQFLSSFNGLTIEKLQDEYYKVQTRNGKYNFVKIAKG